MVVFGKGLKDALIAAMDRDIHESIPAVFAWKMVLVFHKNSSWKQERSRRGEELYPILPF